MSNIKLDLAFEAASFFGLTRKEAENEAQKMLMTIGTQWRSIPTACALSREAQNEIAQAFSLTEAL